MLWLVVVWLPAAPARVTGRRELQYSCGSATFVAVSTCSGVNYRNCYDDVPCGETCEGNGECGTDEYLNNCWYYDDVYERVCGSPTPRPSPRPTPLPPTPRPTPQPTISNVMTDSNIRTAVYYWFNFRSYAEATYGHISTWEMPRTVNGTGHTGPSEFCATSI